MAPLPASTIKSYLSSLLRRTASPSADLDLAAVQARTILPRSSTNPVAGVGVTPPDSIPNKLVFVVFGLIGFGFVVTGIWFFFWAKNGGFHFKQNDWEDYKTTVLRRRGPNGTLLSGASESTDLGGGSVVHGEKRSRWGRSSKGKVKKNEMRYKDFDDEESQVTSSLGTSTVGTESEVSAFKKKMRKGRKDKKKDKSAMSEVGTVDGDMDASVADAIREYRHEKPARVGGINKQPDGSSWDGSNEAASELLSHREKTPTNTPTKVRKERKDTYTGGTGGIRKVVSTSTPSGDIGVRTRESTHTQTKSIEEDRIKAEARKLQEKGRAATSQKRDFSFQAGDDNSTVTGGSSAASEATARRERREERERRRQSRSPTKKMPGSYHEVATSEVGSTETSSEVGTKSYHHVIPGLSSTAGSEYAEERRRKRNGGYRRGRTDSDGE
ncbi:uncharacterized protein LY89DRAFT_683171 [Mollisia scopiformis]|uniref:Endosomal spry domain-containing protein n=1 Tax=Mollisia scopiformis TaxID=149040 RepID=A0A194XGD8_MOLSC|nr:uncharacterized protein LY89DRAFT_683171 [Mollisia scopiformis]KUJ19260.1 hypothetical protein LY89DRAFT_683171 [Mollisia scopiformis]